MLLLLFLILPFCIVASNIELANTLFSESFNTITTPINYYNSDIDMEVDTLRRRLVLSSANISRELSVYSSICSISYVKRMKAQSNDLF